MAWAIFISFIWIIRLRYTLSKNKKDLDKNIESPSDYCLMGKHMEFENYDPQSIENEIKEQFDLKYQNIQIVYSNPVYDISDYYKVFADYNDIVKLKLLTDSHMDAYMRKNKCKRKQYIKII